jgi:hypothetical protein
VLHHRNQAGIGLGRVVGLGARAALLDVLELDLLELAAVVDGRAGEGEIKLDSPGGGTSRTSCRYRRGDTGAPDSLTTSFLTSTT